MAGLLLVEGRPCRTPRSSPPQHAPLTPPPTHPAREGRAALVPLVLKGVRSLRSSVCKTAIMAVGDLYLSYGPVLEPLTDVGGLAVPTSSLLAQVGARGGGWVGGQARVGGGVREEGARIAHPVTPPHEPPGPLPLAAKPRARPPPCSPRSDAAQGQQQ